MKDGFSALHSEESQNVCNHAPQESLFWFLKFFKVNATTDTDIYFIVNWDLLTAYWHFMFRFIKKRYSHQ